VGDELDLVRRIAGWSAATLRSGSALTLGIGDDCAIYSPDGSAEDLLFTTDFLLEDVHFEVATHSAEEAGHKALARALSDIAAMGGDPRFCLVSLAFPKKLGERWAEGFYQGLTDLAKRFGVEVAGGDLARQPRVLVDLVVCGAVVRGGAMLRSGGRVGDGLYVTGPLGASARGLAQRKGKAWDRHRRPEPRVAEGRALREAGVRCAMDLSDGLSMDLHRLALASGLAAEITEVPRDRGATLEQALHGGEDYELLFASGRDVEGMIRIGTLREGTAGEVLWRGKPLRRAGFDHFARG
jgi:thiamine-monophosphate kinase